MDNRRRLYFGCRGNLVDGTTGQRRWFAAVWTYSEGERSVVEYWFAGTEDEAYEKWQHSRWYKHCTVLFTPSPILLAYEEVQKILRQK